MADEKWVFWIANFILYNFVTCLFNRLLCIMIVKTKLPILHETITYYTSFWIISDQLIKKYQINIHINNGKKGWRTQCGASKNTFCSVMHCCRPLPNKPQNNRWAMCLLRRYYRIKNRKSRYLGKYVFVE